MKNDELGEVFGKLGLELRAQGDSVVMILGGKQKRRISIVEDKRDGQNEFLVGVELTEEQQTVFSDLSGPGQTRVLADVISYLCLIDCEYEFQLDNGKLHSIQLRIYATDDQIRQDSRGVVGRVIRAQEGAVQRIRYWEAVSRI